MGFPGEVLCLYVGQVSCKTVNKSSLQISKLRSAVADFVKYLFPLEYSTAFGEAITSKLFLLFLLSRYKYYFVISVQAADFGPHRAVSIVQFLNASLNTAPVVSGGQSQPAMVFFPE